MRTARCGDNNAGTPQGSILSPLLSNVALSVLDEYIARAPGGPTTSSWERRKRRRNGLANYRLVRFADDWCLCVSGTKADAETLRAEIAGVLSTMGLRLSPEKTLVTHIDEGLVFLGWHVQRHRKRGTNRRYVYTYPARKALKAVMGKVQGRSAVRQAHTYRWMPCSLAQPDGAGLVRVLPAGGVQHGLPVPEFLYLGPGHQMAAPQTSPDHLEGTAPPLLRRRLVAVQRGTRELFNPAKVRTTRYRYRGAVIPTPWPVTG